MRCCCRLACRLACKTMMRCRLARKIMMRCGLACRPTYATSDRMRTRAARPSDHSARVQRADDEMRARERATSHEIRHAALTGSRVTRSIKTPHKPTRRLCGRTVACGVWCVGVGYRVRPCSTNYYGRVSSYVSRCGRTAMRARHSTDAVVGATLRADVDTSVHHHHSIHACAHLRSEEERAPWGRCFRALLHRRQAPRRQRRRERMAQRVWPWAVH